MAKYAQALVLTYVVTPFFETFFAVQISQASSCQGIMPDPFTRRYIYGIFLDPFPSLVKEVSHHYNFSVRYS